MSIQSNVVDSIPQVGAEQQTVTPNPLMSGRVQLPGETFTLPSGGLFYRNGELSADVSNAEVHVKPMTTLDEVILQTPDLLFNGEAVKQVFSTCIPQVLQPHNMLTKDIDFLLLCLRKVSYGSELEIKQAHEGCSAHTEGPPREHIYRLNIDEFIQSTVRIDPTTLDKFFTVTLDDKIIKMSPIKFANFLVIMQAQENTSKTPEEQANEFLDSLADMTTSVNDVTEKVFIREWLGSLRPGDIRKIDKSMTDSVSWGPNYTTNVQCVDCKEIQEVVAPLNPLIFFT